MKRFTFLALFLTLPLLITSCRVGNKQTTTLKGYDTLSGFYSALPQTLQVEYQKRGQTSVNSKEASVQYIPAILQVTLKDPTLLYFEDPIKGVASLRNHDDTSIGFTIGLNDQSKLISYSRSNTADQEGCLLTQSILRTGEVRSYPEPIKQGDKSIRGRLSFSQKISYSFEGNEESCVSWLTAFYNCYNSGSGCTQDDVSFAKSIFETQIKAGIMSVEDIKSTLKVSYTANYQ